MKKKKCIQWSRSATFRSTENVEEPSEGYIAERKSVSQFKSEMYAKDLSESLRLYYEKKIGKDDSLFVFLVGGGRDIPVISKTPRKIWKLIEKTSLPPTKKGEEAIPSDMHYACFDLAKGDPRFNLFIGRLPAKSTKDLQSYLNKLFYYNKMDAADPIFSRGLEYTINQRGVGPGPMIGGRNKHVFSAYNQTVEHHANIDEATIRNELKQVDYGFVYIGSHGYEKTMGGIDKAFLKRFKPEEPHVFIMSTLACTSGDITLRNSVTFDLLFANPNFGPVGLFINSHIGMAGEYAQNGLLIHETAARFGNDEIMTLGEISAYSREKILERAPKESAALAWFSALQHNLFGDPAQVWRASK